MGISVFPAPVTSTGGLTAKKISSNFTTPSNHAYLPIQGTAGTLAGGACTKFANSTWVMIHPGGRIATSTDRVTWNYLQNNLVAEMAKFVNGKVIPHQPTWACKSLEFANGTWVGYFSNSLVMKSTDLITWTVSLDLSSSTDRNGTGNGLNKASAVGSLVWNGTASLWMVSNGAKFLFTSPDLITWTERTTNWTTAAGASAVPNKVLWANQLFIVVDSLGQIITSADAITFTLRTAVFGGTAINDGATNGLGSNASATTVLVGAAGKWAYSTNGTTWTANTANASIVHTNIVYDGTRFVVNSTTAATAWYSATGIGGLAPCATPTGLTAGVALAQQLSTNGSGQVVAATLTGFQTSTDVTVAWGTFSTIAILGSAETTIITTQSDNKKWSCVDGAGKVWLTQGRMGRVFVSSDGGVTWTFHNSALTNFTNTTVAAQITFVGLWYLNGNLFAADNTGGLRVSSDNGVTWGARITGFASNIIGMAFGNGVYIAICPNVVGVTSTTSVFRSINATTWTAISTGSSGGAASFCFYNATVITYDTARPRTITFTEDTSSGGYFEILADIGDGTVTVGSKSINGIYWIDGIGGTLDGASGGSVNYQITNNAPAPFSTSNTYDALTSEPYGSRNSTTAFSKGGLQAKSADGKSLLFLRYSTGTANQTHGYIVYKTNSHIQAARSYYQTVEVRGAAPFLNLKVASPSAMTNWATNFEPIYLNYHVNIGWVAAYSARDGEAGFYHILGSSDGISWDVIASIPARYDSDTAENIYIFTNEVDKVFVSVIQNTSATLRTMENFYSFPVGDQPAIA